jgi:hypothetical protein
VTREYIKSAMYKEKIAVPSCMCWSGEGFPLDSIIAL